MANINLGFIGRYQSSSLHDIFLQSSCASYLMAMNSICVSCRGPFHCWFAGRLLCVNWQGSNGIGNTADDQTVKILRHEKPLSYARSVLCDSCLGLSDGKNSANIFLAIIVKWKYIVQ